MTTINELKTFCAAHDITPVGNKSYKVTWQNAIDTYNALQAEASATVAEAQPVVESASVQVEEVVIAIAAALTSPKAIAVYRTVLHGVMMAIVLAVFVTVKVGRWCWENRSRAAVYHWVKDAVESEVGRSVVTHALIAQWTARPWFDAAIEKRDRLVLAVTEWVAIVRGWVGLGGVTIGVQ